MTSSLKNKAGLWWPLILFLVLATTTTAILYRPFWSKIGQWTSSLSNIFSTSNTEWGGWVAGLAWFFGILFLIMTAISIGCWVLLKIFSRKPPPRTSAGGATLPPERASTKWSNIRWGAWTRGLLIAGLCCLGVAYVLSDALANDPGISRVVRDGLPKIPHKKALFGLGFLVLATCVGWANTGKRIASSALTVVLLLTGLVWWFSVGWEPLPRLFSGSSQTTSPTPSTPPVAKEKEWELTIFGKGKSYGPIPTDVVVVGNTISFSYADPNGKKGVCTYSGTRTSAGSGLFEGVWEWQPSENSGCFRLWLNLDGSISKASWWEPTGEEWQQKGDKFELVKKKK